MKIIGKLILKYHKFFKISVLFQAEPFERATCFWGKLSDNSGSVLKTQARKLKTLRHPNVLTYLDSIEVVAFSKIISSMD